MIERVRIKAIFDKMACPLMVQIRAVLIVLITGLLVISSCATPGPGRSSPTASAENPRPLLNSERIREKFGSYGIEVVRDDEQIRVSNLYSTENDQKLTRTLAVVFYPATIPSSITSEHREIKSGQSIGEVFKTNGWNIEKKNIYMGELKASAGFAAIYSLMGEIKQTNLTIYIYQLFVAKEGNLIRYATIAEVYHPDYLDLIDLKENYGEVIGSQEFDFQGAENTLDAVIDVMETF